MYYSPNKIFITFSQGYCYKCLQLIKEISHSKGFRVWEGWDVEPVGFVEVGELKMQSMSGLREYGKIGSRCGCAPQVGLLGVNVLMCAGSGCLRGVSS